MGRGTGQDVPGQDVRDQMVLHFVLAWHRHRPALSMGTEGIQHPGVPTRTPVTQYQHRNLLITGETGDEHQLGLFEVGSPNCACISHKLFLFLCCSSVL